MSKTQNPFCFFQNTQTSLIAPPSIALKTREIDDATVNNHNPSCHSVLSRTLLCFLVGQRLSKQLYSLSTANCLKHNNLVTT